MLRWAKAEQQHREPCLAPDEMLNSRNGNSLLVHATGKLSLQNHGVLGLKGDTGECPY